MVVDAQWCVVFANRTRATLFSGDIVGTNLVRHVIANPESAREHQAGNLVP